MSASAVQYHDLATFREKIHPFLLPRECENCLVFGLLDPSHPGTSPSNPHLLMLAIEENHQAVGVVIQTREDNLVASHLNEGHVQLACEKLKQIRWPVKGLVAPVQTVNRVVSAWCGMSAVRARQVNSLRVFDLSKVAPPKIAPGEMRIGTSVDLDLATRWCDAFFREIDEPEPDSQRTANRLIGEKRLYFWQDEQARSMTAVAGPTPNGIRINHVYTPPEFRGRGYASNLVAAVSQRMLDSGRRFCFLFTDLANPASNKIYQAIGYHPVGDFAFWSFAS